MGISAVASASILIRLADAPALVIASYRVGLATVALGPWLLHQRLRSTARVSGPSLRQAMGSGVFLALHFAFWIQSLQMTSIASSVTLVSTTPVFASLFSRICLREPFDRWMILGVLCSTLGGVWVAGADFRASGEALRGDLLALGGAVMAAGYLVTGRSARRALDLASYTFVAYGVAALVLLLFCAGARLPLWGLSTRTYLALGLLALVPQLIGHTAFNWSLRFLPSTVVAVVLMGEPIGATLLGYLVLREAPAWPKAAGLAILGLGILLCSLSVRRPASPPA
ncbi:MAG: DMT family transporter [Syntrophobacteraceae bacterium]|nr:DMT family transporter [Syntrophobacteraceae bacterium]